MNTFTFSVNKGRVFMFSMISYSTAFASLAKRRPTKANAVLTTFFPQKTRFETEASISQIRIKTGKRRIDKKQGVFCRQDASKSAGFSLQS